MQDQMAAGSKAAESSESNPYKVEKIEQRTDAIAQLAKLFNITLVRQTETVLDDFIIPSLDREVLGYRIKTPDKANAAKQFNNTAHDSGDWTKPISRAQIQKPKQTFKPKPKEQNAQRSFNHEGGSYADYMRDTNVVSEIHVEPPFTRAASPRAEFNPTEFEDFAHLATGIGNIDPNSHVREYTAKQIEPEAQYEYRMEHEADENYRSGVHLSM